MSISPVISQCFLKSTEFSHLPYWEVTLQKDEKVDDETFVNNAKAILDGNAYQLLIKGTTVVTEANEMREGMLSFGALKECGCYALGRREKNMFRERYECIVINQVEKYKNQQVICISAFATGLLFGEYVLLTKIIQKLSTDSAVEKVVFDCIDRAYETYWDQCIGVQTRDPDAISWREDLNKAIPEFVGLIKKTIDCYQAKFKIELRFFSHINCLITHSVENVTTYQLLIGADRGATDQEIITLNQKLKCSSIFLERINDQPYSRLINSNGKNQVKRLS